MPGLTKFRILEILKDWNYWNRNFEHNIPRPKYLKKMELFRTSGEIIVLTGIRRSGKSTLLKLEMEDLAKSVEKNQLLYINFEDPRFNDSLNTTLLDMIFETYRETINPDGEVYLFLDEIQNVAEWEKWVRSVYDLKKATIYITGSSSTLLSGEIAISISGRYLKIDVSPLTFREFLLFRKVQCADINDYIDNKIEINQQFNEYIRYGGFPKIASLSEVDLKKEELISYFNTILLRDIVARYKLRNYDMLKKMVEYILTNDTKLNSAHSFSKALQYNNRTTEDYLNYIKQVYLVTELRNFNYSLKKQLASDKKFYAIDTGFINTVSFRFSENIGRLYENIVYNELIRRGNSIFFLNEGDSECDFIIQDGSEITGAYQVCYDLHQENYERELSGLVRACKKFDLMKGYIITESTSGTITVDDVEIQIIPMTVFLLEFVE